MKEDTISIVFDIVAGVIVILVIGGILLFLPYGEAAHRDSREAIIIDDYLEEQDTSATLNQTDYSANNQQEILTEDTSPGRNPKDTLGNDSFADSQIYKGEIDSILVIDKINLQKAIIRGPYNDYNLDRYLFVTADQTSALGKDNYVIYGHCSQTYGHSFNRLEELTIGDTFQLLQGNDTYEYVVTGIQLELRENAAPLLITGTNTVQLVSCEKKIADGFSEKRLIIVTAERNTDT